MFAETLQGGLVIKQCHARSFCARACATASQNSRNRQQSSIRASQNSVSSSAQKKSQKQQSSLLVQIRLFTRRGLGTANKHPPEFLPAENPAIESQDRIRRLPGCPMRAATSCAIFGMVYYQKYFCVLDFVAGRRGRAYRNFTVLLFLFSIIFYRC